MWWRSRRTAPLTGRTKHDEVYRSALEKGQAITRQIEEALKRQQPVLVGTTSIEKSEMLSDMLKQRNIPHQVLNARYHEQEASIIAQAGRVGAVTIATNMAGRGTDIKLGGNYEMRLQEELKEADDEAYIDRRAAEIRTEVSAAEEKVKQAGGLYVIGIPERHESRRIDNQLRGRSGRQGDPGRSKFYLSLEDDLMRIFGTNRMDSVLQRFGLKEGEAIIHPWINRALERAQQKVEQQHFEVRKNLLKFDDVMNDQRKVIYEQRRDVISANQVTELVTDMRHEVIEGMVNRFVPSKAYAEQWDIEGLMAEAVSVLNLNLPLKDWAAEEGIAEDEIMERLIGASDALMAEKRTAFGDSLMDQVERNMLLQMLDQAWKDHLLALDHLRQGINLRAYGQRDPLNEYKREAFELFEAMLNALREQVTRVISHLEIQMMRPAAPEVDFSTTAESRHDPAMDETVTEAGGAMPGLLQPTAVKELLDPNRPETWGKVQRNALCPCGSGKKYKFCHGQVE